MIKSFFIFFVLIILLIALPQFAMSQQPNNEKDTFFLSKKKGLLGEIGKTITRTDIDREPIIKVNPFLQYTGKIIRQINIVRLGFERNISDTTKYNFSFGTIVANAFHKKTRVKVLRNNLFFKEGDPVEPYLMADNERHFREQPFIQDVLIKVNTLEDNPDSVDVLLIVKDVFSIGGSADISNPQYFRLEVKDENIGGAGTKLAFNTLYDSERKPNVTTGLDLVKRNISGSFIDWNIGYLTYNYAVSSGKKQEVSLYTSLDKPLVSPYIRTVGSIALSINRTKNYYTSDSVYQHDVRYEYNKADAWFGYNFDANKFRKNNIESRVKRLVALRGFYQHYNHLPVKVQDSFDYRYSDARGVLASFIIFKQNFYRTTFIYGFGRNEDVPQGFNLSLVSGWINKKDSIVNTERSRPYYGIDASMSRFNDRGFYSNYIFRLGGYMYKGVLEDVDLVFNVEHFTRKNRINQNWYFRQFLNLGFSKQFTRVLNQPLYLRSTFGLPYYPNGDIYGQLRGTIRSESVFYNLRKFWGFRFAPFGFADFCLMQPYNKTFKESDGYTAIGAGVRTRNENLIFGTIELRAYYFPRGEEGKSSFKVEINTNLRFKYNSTYIRKPDFVTAN